jgi:integrase/recombinase XerD
MTPPRRAPDFATLVRDFFCERLVNQQDVSPHTVAAYRDTFRLLLMFVGERRRRPPAQLSLADLDAPTVLAFLDHLETGRGNSARTRNARLTAIRAFVTYASARDPTSLPLARQILAIPRKRFDRPLLGHLTRVEVEAVLAAPDPADWSGRRDRALFTLMYNTGARVSEAIGVRREDLRPGPSATVRIRGKGRKERAVPLWKATAKLLERWVSEIPADPGTPLFPNRFGRPMSRSGVEDRLARAVAAAAQQQPTLAGKTISPHTCAGRTLGSWSGSRGLRSLASCNGWKSTPATRSPPESGTMSAKRCSRRCRSRLTHPRETSSISPFEMPRSSPRSATCESGKFEAAARPSGGSIPPGVRSYSAGSSSACRASKNYTC